jgi:hypothetical protein
MSTILPFDLVERPRPSRSAFGSETAAVYWAGTDALRLDSPAAGLAPSDSLRYDIAAQRRE